MLNITFPQRFRWLGVLQTDGAMPHAAVLMCLLLASCLSGCSVIVHNYKEPNPEVELTSRLRISTPIGVVPRLTIHPNSESSACLRYDNVQTLPVDYNQSGFPSSKSPRRIGMPGGVVPPNLVRTELYLPAGSDLTMGTAYLALDARAGRLVCTQAFRFRPEAGKNYEMSFVAGSHKTLGDVCQMALHELVASSSQGESILSPAELPRTAVIVKGSRAWRPVCEPKQ